MSPGSSVARPVWVLSLPAVAIFISFLWFRKKRGSLQTDTGGPGESDPVKVLQESPALLTENNNDTIKDEASTSAIVNLKQVDEVSSTVVEENPGVEEICAVENSCSVEESPRVVIAEEAVNCESVIPVEEFPKEQVKPEGNIPPEAVTAEIVSEQAIDTATQSEIRHKAEEPKKEEVIVSAISTPKWVKKRRGKKMSHDASAEERNDAALDQQLAKLELNGQPTAAEDAVKAKASVPDGGERDSANTSPSEVMLASPSLSGYSDTHSEGSSDSGKGCSEVLTPSPTPVSGNSLSGDLPGDLPAICVYEFVIPQHLVGRLIGRNGSFIHEIKDSTHAAVCIKRHPETPKLKICAIEGTQMDIENALDMIRHKFPKKRYPQVTLEPVELPPEVAPVLPENLQLYLVEGVNNDVILCSLVSAGHFFLQQPTHPTYPYLNRLTSCMTICYSEPNLPALPENIQPGVLCAAPVNGGWYRAEVTNFPEGDLCDVKFVDYGGFLTIEKSNLRQIRADFVALPFQAAECLLAAVQPVGEGWSAEAREVVEALTLGKVLQAQVHGYTDLNIPLIFLYTVHEKEVVLVNEELVARGFAEWLLPEPVTEESIPYVDSAQPEPVAV